MGIKLKKDEYDALPESLKTKFTADGDSYELIEEDVEGLKKSKAEILAEKKKLAEEVAELAKFKSEHEAKAAEADEVAMKEAGKFKELEERYKAKIGELEGKITETDTGWRSFYLQEKLKNTLAEKGLRPEMTKYALLDVQDEFELDDTKNLKLKNGIGDAKEIDTVVARLRESTPDFFAAQTQLGGGASGSGNNGGGGKTMPMAVWSTKTPQEQASLIKDGIKPVE